MTERILTDYLRIPVYLVDSEYLKNGNILLHIKVDRFREIQPEYGHISSPLEMAETATVNYVEYPAVKFPVEVSRHIWEQLRPPNPRDDINTWRDNDLWQKRVKEYNRTRNTILTGFANTVLDCWRTARKDA